MVTRLHYEEALFRVADECVRGIQQRVERGWQISEVRGERKGPYLILFRKEAAAEPLIV